MIMVFQAQEICTKYYMYFALHLKSDMTLVTRRARRTRVDQG